MTSIYLPHYLKCPKCGATGFALKEESRSDFQPVLDMAATGNFKARKAGAISDAHAGRGTLHPQTRHRPVRRGVMTRRTVRLPADALKRMIAVGDDADASRDQAQGEAQAAALQSTGGGANG